MSRYKRDLSAERIRSMDVNLMGPDAEKFSHFIIEIKNELDENIDLVERLRDRVLELEIRVSDFQSENESLRAQIEVMELMN